MAKIIKKTEPFESSDIVSVNINVKEMTKEIIDFKISDGEQVTDDIKKQAKESVEELRNDLKELKGTVIESDEVTTILLFPVKKKWMTTIVSCDREFVFNTKDLKLFKRPDKIEALLKKMSIKSNEYKARDIANSISNIESYKRRIEDCRRSLHSYMDSINIESEKLKSLSNERDKEMSFDPSKSKKIIKISADDNCLYLLTDKLAYYKKSGTRMIEPRDQFVIKIDPTEGSYGYIAISNITSYYPESSSTQHCCVSNFSPCLGSVMQSALRNVRYNLNAYVNMIISYLEKPDYEQPYIREDIYNEQFVAFSKNFDTSNLKKAFDSSYINSIK
ncbi:MAG TPA: hypothetical protein PKN54_00750 [Candidatus Cloacimonas acidaminovorans]|nr:hypothetical protein [Candidatus Cloacimonas acidaminovorans]